MSFSRRGFLIFASCAAGSVVLAFLFSKKVFGNSGSSALPSEDVLNGIIGKKQACGESPKEIQPFITFRDTCHNAHRVEQALDELKHNSTINYETRIYDSGCIIITTNVDQKFSYNNPNLTDKIEINVTPKGFWCSIIVSQSPLQETRFDNLDAIVAVIRERAMESNLIPRAVQQRQQSGLFPAPS